VIPRDDDDEVALRKMPLSFRHLLFLTLATILVETGGTRLLANPPICDETCSSATACDQQCYVNMIEFENGNAITCLDYGVYDADSFCCGDFVCNPTVAEDCGTCSSDCGGCLSPEPVCPNSVCETGEFCNTCPDDCGQCGTPPSNCDDDGVCESTEGTSCKDCQHAGFCHGDGDCPSLNGRTYVCANDTCVLEELPQVTNTCNTSFDCNWGWRCVYSNAYSCPGGAQNCKVCVPPWVP